MNERVYTVLKFFGGYQQQTTTGLPMGSPLSPLLSNIFMNHLENKIHILLLACNLIFWFRYASDVLILWKDTTRHHHQFHSQ